MKRTHQLLSVFTLCVAAGVCSLAGAQTLPVYTGQPVGAAPSATPQTSYWIGVAVENIDAATSGWLNLAQGQGLQITKVMKGSPADTAGLVKNDLLIEVNGKPLMEQSQLVDAAQPSLAKDSMTATPVTLTYQRGVDRHSIQITPQQRPASMQVVQTPSAVPATGPNTDGQPLGQQSRRVAVNGRLLDVWPGIRIDTNSSLGSAFTREQFKELMQGGQCVIVSTTTDGKGVAQNSITQGDKTYQINPATSDALPPEIKALAQSLGWLPAQQAAAATAVPVNGSAAITPKDPNAMEKRLQEQQIQEQQRQIVELQKQLDDLARRLREQGAVPPQK